MWWPLVAAVVVVGLWLAVVLRRRFTEPAGAPPLLILDNSRFAAAKLFRGDTGRLIAEAASKVVVDFRRRTLTLSPFLLVWQCLHHGYALV